jgi:hypothetical protein
VGSDSYSSHLAMMLAAVSTHDDDEEGAGPV